MNPSFTVVTTKTFLFQLQWHTAISLYYLICLNCVPRCSVMPSNPWQSDYVRCNVQSEVTCYLETCSETHLVRIEPIYSIEITGDHDESCAKNSLGVGSMQLIGLVLRERMEPSTLNKGLFLSPFICSFFLLLVLLPV